MALRSSVALLATLGISLSGSAAAAPEIQGVTAIIEGPTALDLFKRPATLAVSPDGAFFVVADTGNYRLAVFDGSGRCRGTLPLSSGAPGEPGMEPRSLAIDARGRLYMVNGLSAEMTVFSPRGRTVATILLPEELRVAGGRPASAAVSDLGRIFVLHSGPDAGLYSELPGGRERATHEIRSGVRSFESPSAFAVTPDGSRFAILDPPADRQIQIRLADGTLVASFGKHGEGAGTVSMATHATWGPHDTLWVTDTLRHTITVFDAKGEFLGYVGGAGSGPGQFLYPAACGFLAEDKLVVVERGTERCQILDIRFPSAQQVGSSVEPVSPCFTRSS